MNNNYLQLIQQLRASTVKRWADDYYAFLDANIRDSGSISINSLGLVGARFIPDDPLLSYTSYTPPMTSTSEAQILLIRGLLRNYIATRETKWLEKAEQLTNALLTYYYPTPTIPEVPDEKWVPHWLVNVGGAFTSREFFLNGSASFVNGVATVNIDKIVRVYSVRATNASLSYWWAPDAKVIGTEYEIDHVEIGSYEATIYLKDTEYTGDALYVYVTETGETIQVGQMCEAYPVWRPLEEGEIACAVDTLPWVLDVFELWYDITGDPKWTRACNSTKQSLRVASNVSNREYYIKGRETGENVLVNGVTNYSTRNPPEAYEHTDGLIVIDYPESSGEGNMGRWVGERVEFSNEKHIQMKLGSNTAAKIYFSLDEDGTYIPEKRWTTNLWLGGNGTEIENLEIISLYPEDFYKPDGIVWGIGYNKTSNGSAIASGNSTVTHSDEIGLVNGKRRPFTRITMARGDEGGWYGWAQWFFSIFHYTLPFDFRYKTDNEIDFVINDANNSKFTYRLPKTDGEYVTVSLTENMFSGTGSIAEGSYSSIILDAVDLESTIDIDYLGVKQVMDVDYYTSITFGYDEQSALRVAIDYIMPMPARDPLPYTPYILPFDFHLINFKVSDLRGAIYSGYQVPWIYQKQLYPDQSLALDTNLQFLMDAQEAYEAATGVKGFFAPIFWWDYREDYGDNEPNTFGWDRYDTWGGFQYRTISDVARVLVNEPLNSKARKIFFDFLEGMNTYWTNTNNGFPTHFPKNAPPSNNQTDAHMVTNFMRALVYGLNARSITPTELSLINKLLRKCISFLDYWWIPVNGFENPVEGTWSPDPENQTWYQYWGGDILDLLGELQLILLERKSLMNNNDPQMIYQLRAGTADDPFVEYNLPYVIQNGRISLAELPDSFKRVTIAGYNEIIDTSKGIQSNQYFVDYKGSKIHFNISEEGKTVQVRWWGKGLISTSAARIHTKTLDDEVVETLQDVVDGAQIVLDDVIEATNRANSAASYIHAFVHQSLPRMKSGSIYPSDALFDVPLIISNAKQLKLDTLNCPVRINITSATASVATVDIAGKASAISLVQAAKEAGFRIILEPYPWVANGTISETDVDPENIESFFASWRSVLDELIVDIANVYDVEILTVASNFVKLEPFSEKWMAIMDHVREQYKGLITYRTNWWVTAVWDTGLGSTTEAYQAKLANPLFGHHNLDFINIAAYFELSGDAEPSAAALVSDLNGTSLYGREQNVLSEVRAFWERWKKPIFFGELGCASRQYAAQQPWSSTPSSEVSEAAQSNLYEAYKTVFESRPWFKGYSVYLINDQDSTYSIMGKAAQHVVQDFIGKSASEQYVEATLAPLFMQLEEIESRLALLEDAT